MSELARRDFLQGVAIGVAMTGPGPELAQAAEQEAQNAPGYYPPTRLGMRGSHPGAFEAAHELRDGGFWKNAAQLEGSKSFTKELCRKHNIPTAAYERFTDLLGFRPADLG